MKFVLLPLLFMCFAKCCLAQVDPEAQHAADPGKLQLKTTRLFGKLVDPKNNKGVEAVSVQLFIAKNDSLVAGMLSKPNGDFNFLNIPRADSFSLLVSAIGYEPWKQLIKTSALTKNANAPFEKDLGNIILTAKIKQLENVTVTASRPALEMGIDRKTFNVAKSLTATGGSAIDVMKNIPSVSVDIDGNVKLRNASPQIFVDGRPTILTLDQIPADNIEKVELITNPSAKYDAATSGGIINVVLKKNKRNGLNGIASVSAGSPSVANGNLNLNLRQGKLNFFVIGAYNSGGGKNKGETKRENRSNGITQDYFNQLSINERVRRFRSLRFGVDFFMDNRNTISVIQDLGAGRFTNEETQNQEFLNNNKILQYTGDRRSEGRFGFNRNSTRLNFKHSFPEAGKEFTADLTYNYGSRSDNSDILNNFTDPGGSMYKPSTRVRNSGNSHNNQFTFQADYVYPKGENTKFETGLRSYQNKFSSYYNAFAVDNVSETKLPLSNNYDYTENIHAIYGTYSKKYGGFSYQVGLRAEYAKFSGLLVDSAFKFGYEYPASIKSIWNALFPSIFLTQKINDNDQVQVNFSRRIRRPDFWQLNPFIDISDPVNLRQGNPQLKPEFVNSFEFNYNKTYSSGNFLAVLYLRNNPADITQYSDTITADQYAHLANAGVDPNAILNTFINGSVTNRWGAEFTLQQKWGSNFDITPTANFQYRTVKAAVNGLDLSNNGFNWDAKLIVNYKIVTKKYPVFNNLSFQLSGEYESPEVIPQGKTKSEFGSDFAIRKDFLKNNKATLTFGINDIFNTQRWGNVYDTPSFYQDSYRRWSIRTFRLSFSYRFGKADFSLLNRKDKSNDD
ncbi:MAG: outer membrane beta-barrel family protein [Chitinophagaceae bacterium]